MLKLILLLLSYLVGSIPFGFLTAYLVKGIDVRKSGSGNIGATNVARVVGKKWGMLVFALDFLKGLIAPLLIIYCLPDTGSLVMIIAAILVVCGHNWTPFLGFKGGKGVSTSLGALSGLCFKFPSLIVIIAITVGIWVAIFFMSHIVSLASIISAFAFLVCSFIFNLPLEFKMLSLLLVALIILRHKNNIKNLLQNKELRF